MEGSCLFWTSFFDHWDWSSFFLVRVDHCGWWNQPGSWWCGTFSLCSFSFLFFIFFLCFGLVFNISPVLVSFFHLFHVLVSFFPCLMYRFFSVLLKFQIYRDFPALITTFLCFNYRVFPALSTSFFCFGNIISLFYEPFFPVLFTGFSLFLKNSLLLFF